MAKLSSPAPGREAAPAPLDQRRGFLMAAGALVVGGLVGLVPALSGLVAFLDPLRRGRPGAKFIRVATLEAVPDDGVPREFPVIAEHVDAWNYALEPVGAVYVRRTKDQAAPECLSAICPHAGCFVAFDAPTGTFKCPCHNSTFQVDGQIIEPSPSPRGLDALQCKVTDQEILVKYESFYTGRAEKVVKG
jgi:menaquinol-cytochrome c reductase iron-sulfur subunit